MGRIFSKKTCAGFVTLFAANAAMAWEIPEQSYLAPLVAVPQASLKTQVVASYFDGEIHSYPPDAARHDVRLEGLGSASIAVPISRVRLRSATIAKFETRTDEEDGVLKSTITSKSTTFDEVAQAGILVGTDVEVFAGLHMKALLPYEEKTQGVTTSSSKKFESAFLSSPQIGVLKRSSAWDGGFYYTLLSESKRKFKATASDGTGLDDSFNTFLAGEMGALFVVNLSGSKIAVEGALVRAGDASSQTDEGVKVYRDYYKIFASGTYEVGAVDLAASLMHRTLSYGEQNFMDINNIPTTQLEIACELGDDHMKTIIGLGAVYANDGQSQEQFNAKYNIKNYSARLALATGF